MKIAKYIAILACIALSSCSVFNKAKNTLSQARASKTSVVVSDQTQPASTATTTAATAAATATAAPASAALAAPAEMMQAGIAFSDTTAQLGGEWIIRNVYRKAAKGQEKPYIYLDFNKNTAYGSNGCNVFNADFKLRGNTLSFANVISTLRACYTENSEHLISKALAECATYELKDNNGVIYMKWFDAKGRGVMELKRQNLDFLNGIWAVKAINGEPQNENSIRLVIDVTTQRIHGNTGCNIINGKVYINADKDFAIEFDQINADNNSCPDMRLETEFLIALEESVKVDQVTKDEMNFVSSAGNVVLTLTRTSIE